MTNQEEIKFLLHTYGIKPGWLAEKLDMKLQTFHYLLNESVKFDEELYKRIKEIIKDYQYELDLFDEEPTDNYDLFREERLELGIGGRIRIFAKRKYGTLKNLAGAMQISPQQLQQYISGKREPGSKTLLKLLRLGCDINWLLGGLESLESYKIYKLESELRKFQMTMADIASITQKLHS